MRPSTGVTPTQPRCRRLIEDASELLVIPSPVLPEVDSLVSERMGPAPMLALLRDIESGGYRMVDLETAEYTRTRELMDQYADADIGFVDASVVAITERLREPKLATLDRRRFGIVRPLHVKALTLLPS